MSSLITFLGEILVWLKDLFLWLPLKITELALDGLALVIEAIPVPSFLNDAPGYLSNIDPTVAYFLAAFEFGNGLAIIFSAYILRFLIRRIPLVG